MVNKLTRYDIRSVRDMCSQLEHWIETSEEALSNEESKDYPNEERLDTLQTRIDSLQAALDSLQEIE
jgi:hypothetical protein